MLKRASHPGLILGEELEGLGLTASEFARKIGVPPNRVTQILKGDRSITGDTALRLGHWFGTSPEFWMNLQAHYDLVLARRERGEAVASLPTMKEEYSAGRAVAEI